MQHNACYITKNYVIQHIPTFQMAGLTSANCPLLNLSKNHDFRTRTTGRQSSCKACLTPCAQAGQQPRILKIAELGEKFSKCKQPPHSTGYLLNFNLRNKHCKVNVKFLCHNLFLFQSCLKKIVTYMNTKCDMKKMLQDT